MRRLAALLATSLVVAAAFAAGPSDEITSEHVLAEMNVQRAQHGVGPLKADRRLDAAARDRMRHMEEESFWSHTSPEGMSPFVWIRTRGYDYSNAGENLAAGFETTKLLVASWMESRGHRENILSPKYESCGIAIIDGATTGPASGKSIVVLFASERPPALMSVAEPK